MITVSRGYEEHRLASRLKWLMFSRLLLVLFAITAMLVIESGPRTGKSPALHSYYTLTFACVVNLVYLVAARMGASPRKMTIIQLLVDAVIVTLLVYFTGVIRVFAYLYFGMVIAGSILIAPRAGYFFASLATIMLAIVSTVYFLAAHPEFEHGLTFPYINPDVKLEYEVRLNFLLPYLFFFSLSLHVVAFLAHRLAQELTRIRILNEEILQNMAGGVVAVDRYGGIVFVNPQAATLLGIKDRARAEGQSYREALPREACEAIDQALRGGTKVDREIQLGRIPIQVLASRLAEGPGGIRGVIAIFNDLTFRRQVEAANQRAERFRALLEMSAGMAHEVRNPLASIRGAAQELESSPAASEDDRKLLQVVMRESDRLNKIVGDFLEYASDRPFETTLCSLLQLLNETVSLLTARPETGRVRIVKEFSREVTCRGEADKLKQVFLNLGLNALEACAELGGTLTIRCGPSVSPEGDGRAGALVEFLDDGPGIPPDALRRLFYPFFTTKARGTGMGLAIARKIVQGHDGQILVESRQGKGAHVKVWLPS